MITLQVLGVAILLDWPSGYALNGIVVAFFGGLGLWSSRRAMLGKFSEARSCSHLYVFSCIVTMFIALLVLPTVFLRWRICQDDGDDTDFVLGRPHDCKHGVMGLDALATIACLSLLFVAVACAMQQ